MFTHCLKRLKISVVFTLEFHANCIHKMSFKSFTTSKTSHCPISQSVSNLLHFKLFLLHLGVEGTHLNTMWQDFPLRKPFVPGRGHSESAGGAPSCFCLVLLVFFFELCRFLCNDEEEAVLLLSFGSKCILGCDWISP